MTMCADGAISMGGTTVGRSINCELGLSGTAEISLDDADVRTISSNITDSGEISMDDFYGSFVFCDLGDSVCGGSYIGVICAAGSGYYLIFGPGASNQAWKTTQTDSGDGFDACDGYGNTYDFLANSSHPAGNWTATRTDNGFTDWYLPSTSELTEIFTNCACIGGLGSTPYWSSNEANVSRAVALYLETGFGNEGTFFSPIKTFSGNPGFPGNITRAIRRVPF